VNPADYDAVIAVIGEGPYAEGDGDIGPSGTLRHSSRYPEDLAVLQQVAGKGKPVVTVFLSGRPLWVNDLMNLSDTFIAAWLPGTEGKGVSDLLVAGKGASCRLQGQAVLLVAEDRLPDPAERGRRQDYAPLFAYGYGLKKGARSQLGKLDTAIRPAAAASRTSIRCSASPTAPASRCSCAAAPRSSRWART
jgi:beta-glucosidase